MRKTLTEKPITWAILTGEYPPDPGGVSDYTAKVAGGLAAVGDEVHVFAPPVKVDRAARSAAGIRLCRLPDSFGLRGLSQLSDEISRLPRDTRILVEYVPHAFGYKAMNIAMCMWLWLKRKSHAIDVMFHEVAAPLVPGQPLSHHFMARVHRVMAWMVLRAAQRIFVSTEWWTPLLHHVSKSHPPIQLLPVPSNIPTQVDSSRTALIRARYLHDEGTTLLGHFGTCAPLIAPVLRKVMNRTMQENPHIQWLLIGRQWESFLASSDSQRVSCVADLDATEVAEHLAACDLLVQPYPDGVTTRRSSFMAGLALGVASVTNRGEGTEPIWNNCDGIALTDNSPDALVAAVDRLLADSPFRQRLGRRGREFYQERFDLLKLIPILRGSGQC